MSSVQEGFVKHCTKPAPIDDNTNNFSDKGTKIKG